MSRKQPSRPERPLPLKWEFEPDIPTQDFFEAQDPNDPSDIVDALNAFLRHMGLGRFLAWEAVVAREQGLPLTSRQEAALEELIDFGDEADEDLILYIDDIPRPSEPWYEILNKIVPHLLIEPFRTFDVHYEEQCEGWGLVLQSLVGYADGLSLPPGVDSPIEVVPAELRHKLWLQECFDALSGLGQEGELTLENEEQRGYRMEDFVNSLRRCKDSVQYFDLTLESLLTRVIVPEKDQPILVRELQERLGLKSTADRLADYL